MGDIYPPQRSTVGKVDTLLNKKLEDVEWGEFKLGDLFDIKSTLSFNKDKLTVGSEYDYVTRTSQNQGILQRTGFVNKDNVNPADVWSLGLLQMDFFYRDKPWYAGQFVRKIIPKIELEQNSVLFFTTILNKQKKKLLSGLVRDVNKTFTSSIIKLPAQNGKINFNFIENIISKIEAEKISKLRAYLEENDLDDYELTANERKVLEDFENGKIIFDKYRLGKLFEVNSYKKRFDANKVNISENSGKPYVVRTSLNNGVRGYINEDEQFLNDGNTISFGQDTATMFYQKEPYFTGDKIKILKPTHNKFNRKNALFFVSTMSKSFSSFTWGGSSFNVEIIKNQLIKLPIKNNQPDYDVMETLTSAIQKLVIRDVVEYVENRLTGDR